MRSILLAIALILVACGSPDEASVASIATQATTADTPEASGAADSVGPDAEGATDEPTGPNEAQLEEDAAADAATMGKSAPDGPDSASTHADLIDGDWTIDIGPAEAVTFDTDGIRGSGIARFYIGDRLTESGTFSVEGNQLIVSTDGAAGGTYQLVSKEVDALAYTGGDNAVADEATMLLSRIHTPADE